MKISTMDMRARRKRFQNATEFSPWRFISIAPSSDEEYEYEKEKEFERSKRMMKRYCA
jgi:hypothetical protein